MQTSVASILSTADEAYHNGEDRISEDLEKGERGDTLAEFIAVELREVLEGSEPEDLQEIALQAMLRARDELDEVCAAIEALPGDGA